MSNLKIVIAAALALAAPRAWAQAGDTKPAAPNAPASGEAAKPPAPKAPAAPAATKAAAAKTPAAPPPATTSAGPAEAAPSPNAPRPDYPPGYLPPGYAPPPGYNPPSAYGPPPGYGPRQGYGSPPGYGPPQGYGPPSGYGPPQAYGPPGYPPPPHGYVYGAPLPDRGYHLHDGFFLRLGAGTSYTYLNVANNDQDPTASLSGFGGALEVSVGGALIPGLILAGSLHTGFVNEPKLRAKNDPVPGEGVQQDQRLSLVVLSLLADYYPHPDRGLHFGGSLGVGGSEMEDTQTNRTSAIQPSGVAASLHAGYEWWVSAEWSIGVMGRLTYLHLSDSALDSGFGTTVKVTQSGVQPTLTASFTFN